MCPVSRVSFDRKMEGYWKSNLYVYVMLNWINYRLFALSRSGVCSVEVIFSSKSPKKSSKKMFPFTFQLSGCNCGLFWPKRKLVFCSCFWLLWATAASSVESDDKKNLIILVLFDFAEAGLLRKRCYYCRCVAVVIYRFKFRVSKRFLCKAWVRRNFTVIRDSCCPWRKNNPKS